MDDCNYGVSDSAGARIRMPSVAFSLRKEAEAVVGRLDVIVVNGTNCPFQ
jgi:hypothetical protein